MKMIICFLDNSLKLSFFSLLKLVFSEVQRVKISAVSITPGCEVWLECFLANYSYISACGHEIMQSPYLLYSKC